MERLARIGPRDPWAQKKSNGLYGTLICGALGAVVSGAAVYAFAPNWLAEVGLVGFVAGAAGYGTLLARRAKNRELDEYASGRSRAEEDVRRALAEIEARKK